MEEKQKGGKREGAGRKPTDDPKIPVTVYIETSIVEKNGGKVELAQKILDTVKSDFVANPVVERNSVPRETIAATQPLTVDEAEQFHQQKIDDGFDDNRAKDRIAELQKELANPPKNLVISAKIWKGVRYKEIQQLQDKLNQKQ